MSLFRSFCLLFIFLLSATPFCDAKPPTLTPRDTRVKIEEILKAHVSHQALNDEILKRAMQNYLEEIDPLKTYFIESEVLAWTEPSADLLKKTLNACKQEDFSTFEEIHETLIKTIQRRNNLERKINLANLPKNVDHSEFKELKWVKSEEELLVRLERIKALQLEAAAKISEDTKQQFLQRLSKRRFNREEELIAKSATEKKQLILANVLKSVSSALDSHTAYFTPSEANQFMIQVQQRLFGIGAQLRDDLNGFTIMRILEGSPAQLSNKLKLGDKIIAVNGEPVVGMEITEAVEYIRGAQGTSANLTILREITNGETKQEEKLDIEIIRDEVVLKESRYEFSHEPYGDGVIGILKLFSFYQDENTSSSKDLANAIAKLQSEHHVKGIILDLRNNGGGLLPQAVTVTGLFISRGVVVSVMDNTGVVQKLRNIEGKTAWDGPLLVLTNRASASAAEIVAQTLQDYGRALVVGDPETFGKGTFQTFTLESANYGKVNPKGEFKVTRGRYYTVSGKTPQLKGVSADIVVPGIFSELEIGERFAKFPVENDQIPPSFEDDLSDISPMHRAQIQRLYKFNMQKVLTTYKPYLQILSNNSKERINLNTNYQSLLKELKKKDASAEPTEIYGQVDLQLGESLNIMKDLILLMQPEQKCAASQ